MPEFEATIMETLAKTVIIEAENIDEAYNKVKEQWRNSEYVLDADDFVGVEFDVIPAGAYEEYIRNLRKKRTKKSPAHLTISKDSKN